ncbi:MAG: hypothetical protein VW948_09000 [Burkholderiaceae bacterium]
MQALAASNENSLSSTTEVTAKGNKVIAQVVQIQKKLWSFYSEFRREMASIKKLQKTKIDDAANQIKFSR